MSDPWLNSLLILQDRDLKRQQCEVQVAYLPTERGSAERKIKAFEDKIEADKKELRAFEARNHAIETENAQMQGQIDKYLNQQLQVKKNEEYQALSHEIETLKGKISDLEDEELEILEKIDVARAETDASSKGIHDAIAAENSFLKSLDEKEKNLTSELNGIKEQVASARENVQERALKEYDRIALRHKHPVTVPLSDQKCGGCHMKVSSAVDADARKIDKLMTCDNCGRIVFIEI